MSAKKSNTFQSANLSASSVNMASKKGLKEVSRSSSLSLRPFLVSFPELRQKAVVTKSILRLERGRLGMGGRR